MGGVVTAARQTNVDDKPVKKKQLSRANTFESVDFEDDGEIDIKELFSALRKLSGLFELDESLTRKLAETVLDPQHTCGNTQFHAVKTWIRLYDGDARLTLQEILTVIKYVELFRQVGDDSPEEPPEQYLTCPNRSDVPGLTGKVRSLEADVWASERKAPFSPLRRIGFHSKNSSQTSQPFDCEYGSNI